MDVKGRELPLLDDGAKRTVFAVEDGLEGAMLDGASSGCTSTTTGLTECRFDDIVTVGWLTDDREDSVWIDRQWIAFRQRYFVM